MKTAISIPDELFEKVDELAAESHRSRSQIFADAVRAYLDQRKSESMLKALNEVYSEVETGEEASVRKGAKKRYAKTLKGSKW